MSAEGLKELLSYLQTAEADLVVNDYHSFNDASGEMVSEMHHEFPGKEYRKIYAFEEVCGKVYINMHAATYRTELLKKMGKTSG